MVNRDENLPAWSHGGDTRRQGRERERHLETNCWSQCSVRLLQCSLWAQCSFSKLLLLLTSTRPRIQLFVLKIGTLSDTQKGLVFLKCKFMGRQSWRKPWKRQSWRLSWGRGSLSEEVGGLIFRQYGSYICWTRIVTRLMPRQENDMSFNPWLHCVLRRADKH